MRRISKSLTLAMLSAASLYFGESRILPAQAPAPAETAGANAKPGDATVAAAADSATKNATASAPGTSEKKTYTVPAGTKILLQLRSSVNAKSAKPGDGVYLASTFPVVVGNRVLIPEGVFVQGIVDRVVRAGHVKGRSQLDMHFTSIIFPNGSVVEIPGVVSGLPGADKQKIEGEEGTIEQSPDKGRNAGKAAEIGIPVGGATGSIAGAAAGHPLAGGLGGLGAGLAAVGLVSLFTRGADVNIPAGSQVEMVLQRPLVLEEQNLTAQTISGAAPSMVPAENQPKPLKKPGQPQLVCPPGALGCS